MSADPLAHLSFLVLILIFATRPEETFEPIAAPSRHDVKMKMRDALTDAIVDGQEGAFSFDRRLDGAR